MGEGKVAGAERRDRLAAWCGAVVALSLVGACAGPQKPANGPVSAASGGWQRPSSYDPPGPPGDPWGPWIREASRRFDIPDRWIREVMRQESGGRVGATSPVGAMGLMQVMPGTYRELRDRYGLGNDPYHPYDSIMAGTAYLREMYELYGSPAFLAAYNAGPRRLEDYLWNNRGLPSETRNYVAKIGPRIVGASPNRRAAPEVYAAAEIPLSIPAGPRRMDGATMLALREQRQATDPGIQVARLPAGPVVRMDPIPDGSTSYQVAAVGSVVRMDPIPDGSTYAAPAVVRMDPIPDGSTYRAPSNAVVRMDPIPDGATPQGAARLAESAAREAVQREAEPMPAPPQPAPSYAPSALAALPAPPPAAPGWAPGGASGGAPGRATGPTRDEPRPVLGRTPLIASALARPSATSARPPTGPVLASPATRGGFGLVSTARAAVPAPPPAPSRPASGGWAVQVGAFSTENLARSAASDARGTAATLGSRAEVKPLAQGRSTIYRARVTGLSRDTAQALCDRLRGRGGCMLLSPDAQS